MERNLPWFSYPVIHPPSHHDNQSASYIRYLNNSTSYPASKTMNQPTFQPSSKHLPNQLPRHPVNQLLIQWAIKLSSQPAIQPISYPANRLSSQPAIQPTSHWQRILAAMQYAKRILKYWINFYLKNEGLNSKMRTSKLSRSGCCPCEGVYSPKVPKFGKLRAISLFASEIGKISGSPSSLTVCRQQQLNSPD